MATTFQKLEDLPRRRATQAKNRWGDLVREVRSSGSVAVTSNSRIEVVIMDAGKYREMSAIVEATEQRRQAALDDLTVEFDRRLASLQAPDTRKRMDAVMAARGRTKVRPKAGPSY